MANPFGPQDKVPVPESAEIGKPDRPPVVPSGPEGENEDPTADVNVEYWERCLADAERAEKDWRARGREIIKIYRNDGYYTAQGKKKLNQEIVFNVLYSNTEVMLPNVYALPPRPVVRSRFVKKSEPVPPAPPTPPPMPMGMPGMGPPPPVPPDQNALGNGAGGGGALPPEMMMGGGAPPLSSPPQQLQAPGPNTGGALEGSPDVNIRVTTEDTTPPPPPEIPPPPPPEPPAPPALQPAPMPPGMPAQADIETAAAVMEKALEIVLDDQASHEAIKSAVKDLLLPGRGLCRVRWNPKMEPAPPPPVAPFPTPMAAPFAPQEPEMVKVWETVSDEYVYWEDVLIDPVRQFGDTQWVAFRHLFTEKQLMAEFEDSEQLQALKAKGKLDEVLKWTDESAAKDTVGGGGAMKTADRLGDVIKKAMVWEIWSKDSREIIWFIRESNGLALRVDPDALGLRGFFPIPRPLLAVTTTDSQLPRPYYDLYKHLAKDLDETSARISSMTEKIKVRGGYNASNRDVANMLLADDGKMIPIDGVDMMNGGLQNHIWLVPVLEWMNTLKELYLAREQTKGAIYEIMGISDIMRGNSNPYETATAQRIKGTMGTNRLDGQKTVCANFALDLLRMKAEIVAGNFDALTLTRMTGEEVTPAVEAILRDDFQRVCAIDIETDSTIAIDETQEQESNAKILMALNGILQGAQGMMMTGVLPPPMVMQFTLELIKMMIQPLRNSRGVVELINDFQEQLMAMTMANPAAMMPGGPVPNPAPGAGPPGAEASPAPPGGPPGMNGGAPPTLM